MRGAQLAPLGPQMSWWRSPHDPESGEDVVGEGKKDKFGNSFAMLAASLEVLGLAGCRSPSPCGPLPSQHLVLPTPRPPGGVWRPGGGVSVRVCVCVCFPSSPGSRRHSSASHCCANTSLNPTPCAVDGARPPAPGRGLGSPDAAPRASPLREETGGREAGPSPTFPDWRRREAGVSCTPSRARDCSVCSTPWSPTLVLFLPVPYFPSYYYLLNSLLLDPLLET